MSSLCFLYPPPPPTPSCYMPLYLSTEMIEIITQRGGGGYSGFQVTGMIEGFFQVGKLA